MCFRRILDEFGSRGWMPLKPHLLDYENTQFLLIGHKENALEKAAAQPEQDDGGEKETPLEELEKLEEEDEGRVEGLKGMCYSFSFFFRVFMGMIANDRLGDDAVFADLGLSAQEFSKLQTTW